MPSLWKFGGLTPIKLIQLAAKKIGDDELSTRSAALSYYFMGALFPMFLFLVSLVGIGIFSVVAVAGLFGLSVPFIVLSNRRNKRQRILAEQLPEALDFLSRILRAGHSLSTGLQMMGTELPDPLGEIR